jgi:hypothetical protein
MPQASVVDYVLEAGAKSSCALCAVVRGIEADQLPRVLEIIAAVGAAPGTEHVVLTGISSLRKSLWNQLPPATTDLYYQSFLRRMAEALPGASAKSERDVQEAVAELRVYATGPAGARSPEMEAYIEFLSLYSGRLVTSEYVVDRLVAIDCDILAVAADIVGRIGYISFAEDDLFSKLPLQRLGPSLIGLLDRSREHRGSVLILTAMAKSVLNPESRFWSVPELAEIVVTRYLPRLRFGQHHVKRVVDILNEVSDKLSASLGQSCRSIADNAEARSYYGLAHGGLRKFISHVAFDGVEDQSIVIAPWGRDEARLG